MTVTFTKLPLEVRNEIYKSLFNVPRCKSLRTLGHNESQLPKMVELPLCATRLPYTSFPGHPAILHTCHQIYHEAVPLLYANRVFERYVMENVYFDDRVVRTCVFADDSVRHAHHCRIHVGFNQPPEATARHIAQLANVDFKLKRLELIFVVKSYRWTWFEIRDLEYHEYLISKLTSCSELINSIAALKVLHNIYVVLTNTYIRDETNTLGDIFESFVQAVATAKAWPCDETTFERGYGKTGKEEHQWVWHLSPPIIKRS